MSSAIQLPRTNLIIGGNFSTNPWQRGTSSVSPGTSSFIADRFNYGTSGTGVVTITKATDAPTVSQAGILSQNCAQIAVTTADVAIAATDKYHYGTKVEGYDYGQIAQTGFTFSFWHKHTKTGIYCVAFQNSGADRSYVVEYTQVTTDTWEFTSMTIPASPSAGTWDYTTGLGIYPIFTIAAGANYQTAANAWQVGGFLCTANQVNGMDTNGNNFRIQLVQMRAGTQQQPWETRSEDEEFRLCQRYCQVITGVNYFISGYFDTTTAIKGFFTFPVMRAAPTITLSASTLFDADRVGTSATTTSSDATANITVSSARVTATAGSASTAGFPTILDVNAGNTVTLDAEI